MSGKAQSALHTHRNPWFASVLSAGHGERSSPSLGAMYGYCSERFAYGHFAGFVQLLRLVRFLCAGVVKITSTWLLSAWNRKAKNAKGH